MVNKTIVQGRMTKDPELRQTTGGIMVCSFTVAWSKTVNGRETKLFLPCVAWRATAEMVAKWFAKGKEIVVEGELITRSYEDRDGNKRNVTELQVDRVHFCGKKDEGTTPYEYGTGGTYRAERGVDVEFDEEEDDGNLPF